MVHICDMPHCIHTNEEYENRGGKKTKEAMLLKMNRVFVLDFCGSTETSKNNILYNMCEYIVPVDATISSNYYNVNNRNYFNNDKWKCWKTKILK